MPALADEGFHCVAVSLRGHGESEGQIRGTSIRDYVEDVSSVVAGLGSPPVVVGHSMGGFTTQHYLASGEPARAAVLVSPVPSSLAWRATLKAARRHPGKFAKVNLTLDVGALVESREAANTFLAGPNTPDDFVEICMDRLERASYRTFIDLLTRPPDLSRVDIPSLVVGGSEDAFFSVAEWKKTADALGGDLVVLDGVGHQPMWEDEGKQLTAVLEAFIRNV